ncbi:MAG TPA: class II glutamine amidotransferase [Elusimicrobia bacterium]|nr:class II glutamine amidotransferase [Elusimicrobiota bacterium]
MCRMLGIKNFDYQKHKKVIEEFFKLAQSGKTLPGNSPGHLDGWGIGYYQNGQAIVFKSGNSVVEEKDKFFKKIREIAKSKILILHFRKSAWKNTSNTKNAHPFKYKNYLFAHNGTIYDYKHLLKMNALDSETFFRFILGSPGNSPTEKIKKAVENIKNKHKFSSLTFLFSEGINLYAYRDYQKSPDYYTLYQDNSLISSQPLPFKNRWKILKSKKLVIL